ncbi:MAG: deoxyribose-phosphate aldolase [Acidobacteriota bacterium]|nr:deoxyribose-phosphate aldolase [Acidobacteriota bacterium]
MTPAAVPLSTRLTQTALRPEWTELEAAQACELAKRLQLASVTVRPCDIDVAVRILTGSSVIPGSTAGFPHGDSNTGSKLYEGRDLLRRGAREIDMVINIAKLRSRQFQYIDTEIMQMSEACRKEKAILRVTLETGYLTDEQIIVACRMCGRAEVAVVKDVTGFGPPGTQAGLRLLRQHLPEGALVEAGHLSSLTGLLQALDADAARISTPDAQPLLQDYQAHLAPPPALIS